MENRSPAPLKSPFPEASKPDTPEPPVFKPSEEPKKPKNKLVSLLVFLLLVALGVIGYFGWQNYQLKLEKEVADVQPEPSPAVEIDGTADWETYEDKLLGFSFKYPIDVKLSDLIKSSEEKIQLNVLVTPVDELADAAPFGYTKATALSDRESLKNGKFGKHLQGLRESHEVIKIVDDVNAKVFTILQEIEVCNVQFVRKAIFYYKGNQIILSFSAPKDNIISENSEYFSTEPANCGEMTIWSTDDNSPLRFYQALAAGQTVGQSQYWYDTFNQILSTFKFVDGSDETAEWKEYRSEKFGIFFKYPSYWKFLEEARENYDNPNRASGFRDECLVNYSHFLNIEDSIETDLGSLTAQFDLEISVTNPEKWNLETWINKCRSSLLEDSNYKTDKLKINNHDFHLTYLDRNNLGNSGIASEYHYYTEHNNKFYTFLLTNHLYLDRGEQIVKSLLESISFTD